MSRIAFKKRDIGSKPWKVASASGLSILLLLGQTAPVLGNPTGGTVVAGAATIGSAGPTLTINQSTSSAIINWQQFSIANGETTKFIVPNGFSATLNRVTGGNPSAIYGTLQSNGTLYLINPSGIIVGPSGRIDAASFLASTLDVSNQQFLKRGDLSFTGASDATVENDGVIHASTGDVYLIASQVNNNGALIAPQGNVGLAAGSDVLFQQAGNQHLFVQATPAGTKRAVGVSNTGTIRAAAAELKAAGGNAYALAINNTGEIAATGFKKINGQVYLTSDGGSIANSGKISAQNSDGSGGSIVADGTATSSTTSSVVTNSGTLDASAIVAGGQGGSVTLKDKTGTAVQSGAIFAKGGQGGTGGAVDISGASVVLAGTVNTTAPGGQTGTLLIDPLTETVAPNGGDTTGAIVSGLLASNNVTLNADDAVVVNDAITWTSGYTLTLSTNTDPSTIVINQPISGVNGGLTIAGFDSSTGVTTGATGTIHVANFILQDGTWVQSGTLPAFIASHDFEIQGGTFLRVAGGDGSTGTPFQITDIYGLEGLNGFLGSNAELMNNIDATGTATWNSGAGWVPIGTVSSNYLATFNGQGHTINGLTSIRPDSDYVGLFGEISEEAVVENVNLTNENISGSFEVGGVVGGIYGLVTNCSTSGTITAGSTGSFVGGVVGGSSGNVVSSSSSATVSGDDAVGGLVGANGGGVINMSMTSGVVSGNSDVGGLVGADNGGVVENSSSTATVNGTSSVGGLIGGNNGGTVTNSNGNGSVNGNGGNGNNGGNGGGGGGGSSSSTPSTTTGGADDGGSNIVPPAIVPQNPNPTLVSLTENDNPATANLGDNPPPPPFNFTGNGTTDLIGEQGGGLAGATGNAGQIGAGDIGQLGNGQLNNVSNSQAAGALNLALGPAVFQGLTNALQALGDWADAGASTPGGDGTADGGGDQETILSGGDVAEVGGDAGVKNIPLSKAPIQLQNALAGDVRNGLGAGAGH